MRRFIAGLALVASLAGCAAPAAVSTAAPSVSATPAATINAGPTAAPVTPPAATVPPATEPPDPLFPPCDAAYDNGPCALPSGPVENFIVPELHVTIGSHWEADYDFAGVLAMEHDVAPLAGFFVASAPPTGRNGVAIKPGAAKVMAYLAAAKGVAAGPRKAVVVAGHHGFSIDVQATEDIQGILAFPRADATPGPLGYDLHAGAWARFYALDVEGTTVIIIAEAGPGLTLAEGLVATDPVLGTVTFSKGG
jgi:hypothetical protein